MGLFKKIKEAWLASMSFDNLDDAFYEELEEALILADVGVETASVEFRTVDDQEAALAYDVRRIRTYPLMPQGLVVAGAVYDVVVA